MGTRNSHSTNTALSSCPFSVAIQSCPIAFEQLTAFLPCYVPVSAFAFRLGRSLPDLPFWVLPGHFYLRPIRAHVFKPALFGDCTVQCQCSGAVLVSHPVPEPSIQAESSFLYCVPANNPASSSFVIAPLIKYRSPPMSGAIRSRFSSSRISFALIQPFCRAVA